MNQPYLILVRHGNTFETGETPVWVGARTDLPLTAKGEEQAMSAIRHITEKHALLSKIYAGPLKRTTTMAAIMASHIGKTYEIENRLREIDYGSWEGLSNAEITEQYGTEILSAWDHRAVWPEGMGWKPNHASLIVELKGFLSEQSSLLLEGSDSHIAITSNGLLRLIHGLVTGAASPECKVRTGSVCTLKPLTDGGWQVESWDVRP